MLKPSPSLLLAALCGIFAVGFTGASAQQPASLPDIRKLMTEVEEHQKQLDKVRENSTYTSLQTTQDLDSNGQVKKTESTENEDFFVNNHVIERMVKKDGKPLDAHGEQKETERVTKQVEKAEKTPPDQPLEGQGVSVSRVLEIMDVRNPRRESYRGRTAIHELLDLTDPIRELILEKKPTSEVRKLAQKEGMQFLRESALDRVRRGFTTLKEINKVTFIEASR